MFVKKDISNRPKFNIKQVFNYEGRTLKKILEESFLEYIRQ